ncbi:MAG: hypothetical protein WC916_02605 [Candidatus Woesearchaeota archaeon]
MDTKNKLNGLEKTVLILTGLAALSFSATMIMSDIPKKNDTYPFATLTPVPGQELSGVLDQGREVRLLKNTEYMVHGVPVIYLSPDNKGSYNLLIDHKPVLLTKSPNISKNTFDIEGYSLYVQAYFDHKLLVEKD